MTRNEKVTQQVREEVLDHLRDFQKYGPAYIEAYVDTIIGPATTRRPKMKIHPKLAELVRELALDAAVMDRGLAGRSSTTPTPFTGRSLSRSRPSRENKAAA